MNYSLQDQANSNFHTFFAKNSIFNSKYQSIFSGFDVKINNFLISNSGHTNIDNNAEIYSPSKFSKVFSSKFSYKNSWLNISLEPYFIEHRSVFPQENLNGTYKFNNNHLISADIENVQTGLKQSNISINLYGIGFSYGKMSHWWGPGIFNSISLSSNAPSQESFVFGSTEDLKIKNFSINMKLLLMPYRSSKDIKLFFSGLNSYVIYHSDPKITIGFNRTFLSGDFSDILNKDWTINDDSKLVFEPIFGQKKKKLDYVVPGSPGFDYWDQILSGYIKLTFPKEKIEIYGNISSDDSRGNFTDLRAHWDHTLGYILGLNKLSKFGSKNILLGFEYLSLKKTNTSKFYRGYDDAYYAYSHYDYFTYKNRRMGAHSGSSSDDFYLYFGLSNDFHILYSSINIERHGIKSVIFPELKTEYLISYHNKINNYSTIFLTIEYEKIKNYAHIKNKLSVSPLIWLGYTIKLF